LERKASKERNQGELIRHRRELSEQRANTNLCRSSLVYGLGVSEEIASDVWIKAEGKK
jgi:hypothetical protein